LVSVRPQAETLVEREHGAAGRLTLVKKTGIVRSITGIHHEKTGAPRDLIQVIF
jgi:hypothetical protein